MSACTIHTNLVDVNVQHRGESTNPLKVVLILALCHVLLRRLRLRQKMKPSAFSLAEGSDEAHSRHREQDTLHED